MLSRHILCKLIKLILCGRHKLIYILESGNTSIITSSNYQQNLSTRCVDENYDNPWMLIDLIFYAWMTKHHSKSDVGLFGRVSCF